jgi:hypothetical protein
MKDHELTPTLQNYLIGWRLQAVKERRRADLYMSMSVQADKDRFGDCYGEDGRACIRLAEVLEMRVQAALEGYVFSVKDDLVFEKQHPELCAAAQRQGRFVNVWPIADHDGTDLVIEAKLNYEPSMSSGA